MVLLLLMVSTNRSLPWSQSDNPSAKLIWLLTRVKPDQTTTSRFQCWHECMFLIKMLTFYFMRYRLPRIRMRERDKGCSSRISHTYTQHKGNSLRIFLMDCHCLSRSLYECVCDCVCWGRYGCCCTSYKSRRPKTIWPNKPISYYLVCACWRVVVWITKVSTSCA